MPEPFIGEIRMFGGNFAPAGWAFCDGQLVPISENDALFILLGTTFGGDGQETFALPNLQSRVPMHQGNGNTLGETGGVETVTLTTQQIPSHTHPALGSNSGASQVQPGGAAFAQSVNQIYSFLSPVQIFPQAITPVGGSQPHENLQPYLCINFIISLFGVFPQQN
ncbi:MAG: phage tail protein [Acidobacteria bacterium]|nr:phage tail protein [Acidobacteriota bacterium]